MTKKTQIQVSEELWIHIQLNKKIGETHDQTLKRLLGLTKNE